MNRRDCLKTMLSMMTGLLSSTVWAKRQAFANQSYTQALQSLLPGITPIVSEQIQLHLPDIAENGAAVPISIDSTLSAIEMLHIVVEKNPTPLAASFQFSEKLAPTLTTRIKMAESCQVIVLAKHQGQWLQQQRWVTVITGGCGTG